MSNHGNIITWSNLKGIVKFKKYLVIFLQILDLLLWIWCIAIDVFKYSECKNMTTEYLIKWIIKILDSELELSCVYCHVNIIILFYFLVINFEHIFSYREGNHDLILVFSCID